MSGEDIGIVIISEQGRVYTSDNADAVIHRLENRSQQEASTNALKRLRRSDCGAFTHGYRSQRIVKERETLSLLCRPEDSSTCLHDNDEDAGFVKRSTDDDDVVNDDDGAGTHNRRPGRIVNERDDHDNRNETTILKFKSLWLEHQRRTLTTTADCDGNGGDYNSYEDTDTDNEKYKNRKAVEEQDVIPFIDYLKIKDEDIKGCGCGRDHRRWVACLQLLVVGITFTGASAFIHFQAISNGERGGPGLIRRQDLLVLGLL
ncbi:hypothetical protein V6N13_106046 [Hibiscus sabdariffa]|uniref:Uncharacterized protein n=1 Tax=Hibiscus sabdariffa TaxID=183260 RepID=A0ABR2EZJ7_9ROSI